MESLVKLYKTASWNDLVSTLTHQWVQLFYDLEPIVRKHLEKMGYRIDDNNNFDENEINDVTCY